MKVRSFYRYFRKSGRIVHANFYPRRVHWHFWVRRGCSTVQVWVGPFEVSVS